MRGKAFLERHLHRYLSTAFLSCIAVIFAATYYHFHLPVPVMLVFTFLWVAGVCAFDQNKKTPIPYLMVIIIAIVVIVLCDKNEFQLGERWKAYSDWLRDMAFENETPTVSDGVALAYTLLSILFINIICTPFYFLTKWRCTRFVIAILASISGIVITFVGYHVNPVAAAFFYAYLYLCLIEASIFHPKMIEAKKSVSMTTFLSPFVLILLVLLCLIPTKDSPMEFRTLKRIWNQLEDYSNQLAFNLRNLFDTREINDFSLSFSGFTEDGTIKGALASNDEVALTVKDLSDRKLNIYLIGNVKNEFTGSGWIDSVPQDNILADYNDYELDLYELVNLVNESFDSYTSQEIMHTRRLDVKYRKMDTKTLFYSLKTGEFNLVQGLSDFNSIDASLTLNKLPEYKAEYQLSAFELRLGSAMTDNFLMEHTRQPYQWNDMNSALLKDIIQRYLGKVTIQEVEDLSTILQYRAQKIHENYTQLPEGLSERVITLSKELTKDATSGYEKLKLIEAYLNTYTYTTHPKEVPGGTDLIDYFLFESKEGYCTYFASAMAIMARCIGIPTSYVQGYCIPTSTNVEEYQVTGNQAHAWVEAYFEGVGWLPFEPTAGYSDYMYRSSQIYNTDKQEASIDYSELYKHQMQVMQDEIANEMANLENDDSTLTRGKTYAYTATIILGIIFLASLISVLYLFFRIKCYNLFYEKASREEKLNLLLQRVLLFIQHFKLCEIENPTLFMQFQSLNEVNELQTYQPLRIADYYMKLCYSDEMLSESEENEMVEFYRGLLNYAKQHTKRLNYFMLTLKLIRLRGVKKRQS